ncbi:trypsin-like serine protease [Phenylobacterium sp.]|uniref:trypsin-like serine protease n=1 Tax=Phenylobacterium sp. TaxID=1871053 RepID=UPI002FC758FB
MRPFLTTLLLLGACVQEETNAASEPPAPVAALVESAPVAVDQPTELGFTPMFVPKGGVQVINGRPIVAADWPALIKAQFTEVDPATNTPVGFNCTATIIGPRTLLTAAHCLDKGGAPASLRSASLTLQGFGIPMRCAIPASYANATPKPGSVRTSADYALCLLDADLGQLNAPGLRYERLNLNSIVAKGSNVAITGWGCTKAVFKPGGGFAHGEASPKPLAVGAPVDAPAGSPAEPNYLATRSKPATGGALCPGDSGGPLYRGPALVTADYGVNGKAAREVVAVNSSIAAAWTSATQYDLVSRYSAVATPDFRAFLDAWIAARTKEDSAKQPPRICGKNLEGGKCAAAA